MGVSGLAGILTKADKLLDRVHHDVNKTIVKAVTATYNDSQILVAVDTGELRASGRIEADDLVGLVIYGTNHCWFVECGTSRQAAQPFLYPNFVLAGQQWLYDLQAIPLI